MISKAIQVDGREVTLRASAAILRMYRFQFGRDIIQDIQTIERDMKRAQREKKDGGEGYISLEALSLFENVAYLMNKHGDPSVPDTVEEWMEGFNVFSIYTVFPVINELWMANMHTRSIPVKKKKRRRGK